MDIKITINGVKKVFNADPGEKLLDLLRREGYKGAKRGCSTGDCGSCAVIINGKLVNSCLIFAGQADGHTITTIEAIGTVNEPHIIQRTFVEEGAVQCGFCTPGMILATKVLLDKEKDPTLTQIREALSGNLCRCTGYVKIENAVIRSAEKMRSE